MSLKNKQDFFKIIITGAFVELDEISGKLCSNHKQYFLCNYRTANNKTINFQIFQLVKRINRNHLHIHFTKCNATEDVTGSVIIDIIF